MSKNLYGWLSVFLGTCVIILRLIYISLESNQDEFISSTQSLLEKQLIAVERDDAAILNYLSDNKELVFTDLNKIATSYPFYIFKNNQLVFWSDDHIIPAFSPILNPGWQFVSRKSGEFLYWIRKSDESNVTLVFVMPLHQNYDINNDYVQSNYNDKIFQASDISIRKNKISDGYPMFSTDDSELFYINLKSSFKNHNEWLHLLIIAIEILTLAFFIIWFYGFSLRWQVKPNYLPVIIFIPGIIVIRVLLDVLRIPFYSAELSLFDPKFFASSGLNPSFGILFLNTVFLLIIIYFVINYLKILSAKGFLTYNFFRSCFLQFSTFGIALLIYGFIELIYRHSNWGLDITNSVDFNIFKILTFVGGIIYAIIIFHVMRWIHQWNSNHIVHIHIFFRDQLISLVVFVGFCIMIQAPFLWVSLVVLVLNFIVYYWHLAHSLLKISFLSFIYLFLIVTAISLVSSWSINHMEEVIETNEINSIGNRIMNDNDVLAEYSLTKIDASIKQDQFIRQQFLLPITPYKKVADKILKFHLRDDYFDKYEKSVSIYDASGQSLYPSGQASYSASFPTEQLSTNNKRAGINLYLVGTSEGAQIQNKYIYKHEIKISNYILASIVVELKLKKIRPDNVFPELLVDKRFAQNVNEIPYDYALYKNDTLFYSVGNLSFPNVLDRNRSDLKSNFSHQREAENSKITILGEGNELLVFSRPDRELFTFFSNFSFFFILCFTIIFTFSFFYFLRAYWQADSVGLGAKIQLYFSLAFLVPLISVSISTVSFVNSTFLSDIVNSYQERTSRVAEQLTDIVMEYNKALISREDFNNELVTITKIVNSDMNIYGLNGKLIITSQPQIFEKQLLSEYINPVAFAGIKYGGKKVITLENHIGELNYQSAYIGIRSYDSGELLAILASPFFKSNKEYDELLTDLLTNVFNIFVASFIIFMFLAYAATKVLTNPLNLLKEKLAQVNLSATNEPIAWKVDDEIGLLITEYNDMLLKLEKSRMALSKTEKESAWREMAQQVAHEIKNPLTPMKLSLQHLQMRIEQSDHQMPEAVSKIKAILSQVDNLSDIATSFSSFAKMPIPDNERVCISEVLGKVVSLFQLQNNHIVLQMPEEPVFAWVDKKIIERIFNNMIINAFQSQNDNELSTVEIELNREAEKVLVSIKDNGMGIPAENHQKVFLPNFTTKSTGSGIGLAIAKRGIEHAGGKIWFESNINAGTTFYIELKYMM